MNSKLTPLQRSFIEEMGNIYANYGLKRLKGLIIGLLLTTDKPISLDEISELLDRSKGPISEAVRELALRGLIKKVAGPENRKDYYVAEPDIFYNNFRFNMRTVLKNRMTAEYFLEEIGKETNNNYTTMKNNLDHMKKFYTLMESFYNNFSTEWQKVKKNLK